VTDLLNTLFGPLLIPELRRSGSRAWIILIQTIGAFVAALVSLSGLWWWWFASLTDPYYSPTPLVTVCLVIFEFLAVTVVMVITPALLAGSLAGDKERGSLGLLLTTRVSSLEIVLGRLAGKLGQVALISAAGIPFFVWFVTLSDYDALQILSLLALPASLAIALAGISLAASALSRRGRNALLGLYTLEAILLIGAPFLMSAGLNPFTRTLSGVFNPFLEVSLAFSDQDPQGPWLTIAIWLVTGIVAVAIAAFRLRPATLKLLSGDVKKVRGRGRVPVLDEARPMLWKELYIERVGALGWFGKALGILLLLYLIGGPLILGGIVVWLRFVGGEDQGATDLAIILDRMYADGSLVLMSLIVLAIGLRAAISISSERERNTWDSLLTSPLEGQDIVRGKIWGSIYSLRWLGLAAVWAWTITYVVTLGVPGGMKPFDLIGILLLTGSMACFITAIGVRSSLATASSTKSITVTVATWLGMACGLFVAACVACGLAAFLLLIIHFALVSMGWVSSQTRPLAWVGLGFLEWVTLVQVATYTLLTFMIISESRLRFDRIAGRMAGGELQVAIDQAIHGDHRAAPPLPVDKTGEAAEARNAMFDVVIDRGPVDPVKP
jgi:ABC-type Na+ efflux pump permease subunit